MAEYPPFMNASGLVSRILEKMKDAQTPDRFTQDYLANTLGFSGGSAKAFIPLAKRLGLLGSDGTPTELYKKFRNPDHSRTAMAQAIRRGYSELYKRNENVHALDRKNLSGLVKEVTGLDSGSSTLTAVVSTFEALRGFADFSVATPPQDQAAPQPPADEGVRAGMGDLRFAYTIYLNLPNTSDVAVFNAIFRSLRENLLR